MRIRGLSFTWQLCVVALVLFVAAMLLPVAGYAARGWNMVLTLEFIGGKAVGLTTEGASDSRYFALMFLLAALGGLGNLVFLVTPLALWRRWSPGRFRVLLLCAVAGLLMIAATAAVLVFLAKFRYGCLLWLLAYIPLILCLILHCGRASAPEGER